MLVLPLHNPLTILALETSDEEQEEKIPAHLMTENENQIALYEEPSQSSNVLALLDNGTEIIILEKLDQYTFVEWIEQNATEENIVRGYVLNEYVKTITQDEQITPVQEQQTKQTIQNQKMVATQTKSLHLQQDTNESLTKNNSTIVNTTTTEQQVTLKGIALKNKTHVYKELSRDRGILKSYNEGVILKFKTLNNNWYEANVKINGKFQTGYIHKSDVELIDSKQQSLKGFALQASTHVYSSATTNAKKLKSYTRGTILKFKSLSANWYEAKVKVNGKYQTGYIHKNHVEIITNKQEELRGIALHNLTRVYSKPYTSAHTLRTYAKATILKYKTFSANWYESRVKVNGKWKTGYIHKNHVENITKKQENLRGIAINHPTRIYSKTDTNSSSIKSYTVGSILKYKTFSANWYEAKVKVNGKYQTGYIHKNHVENATLQQTISYGMAFKKPTKVYQRASSNSTVLKTYNYGQILKYKTFTNNWFEATVKINGVSQTGYIHKNDVGNRGYEVKGFALKSPTNVYSSTSRNANILKSYDKGTQIKYQVYDTNWFKVTVIVNGRNQTGYIHVSDVGLQKPPMSIETKYNLTLEEALAMQLKVTPLTDNKYAYVSKEYIKNGIVTASALNVRVGPSTSYPSLGTISQGTKVDIIGESNDGKWYVIKFNHNTWVTAMASDVLYYLDPNNFINDVRLKFQFLDLSKPSGAPASLLNNFLADKGILKGHGETFIQASKLHGVNDIYLIAHALLETGNGKSALAQGIEVGKNKNGQIVLVSNENKNSLTNVKKVYNMFGIGAFDSCPIECGAIRAYEKDWTTPAKAIIGGAEFIGNDYIKIGQNTLYKMRWNPASMEVNNRAEHQYASDIGWAVKQVSEIYNLYQTIGYNDPIFDIPVYKK